MSGKERPVARKDEECEESYTSSSSDEESEDSYSSPSSDEDEGRENSARRNSKECFQSLQASLKCAFDDYCKQCDDMEADLVRAKRDNKKLAERNKKLEEELKRAKEREESSKKIKEELKRAKEEESTKKNREQTKNKLRKLCTTFVEECDHICNQHGAAPQLSNSRKFKAGDVNDLLNCTICFQPWTQ